MRTDSERARLWHEVAVLGVEMKMGMAEQSATVADQVICHVKQCTQQATHMCDRCGRAYCAEHIRSISIERRQVRDSMGGGLTRLPTRIETYWLCPFCWNKPVPGKQALQTP